MTIHLSSGLENVLTLLRPRGQKRTTFPGGIGLAQTRIGATERVGDWLARCVDHHLGGNPGRCRVEEHVAIFAVIHWHSGVMRYLNCQVVVALEGTIDDLYCDPGLRAQYLRLDYDLQALGSMFREPAPHIHVHPDGEPRFALATTQNVLMDFFDFVYRNYCYDQWLRWATDVWERDARRQNLDLAALNRVHDAFDSGSCEALEKVRKELDAMKRAWRRERDALWPHVVPARETSLLCYEPSGGV